MREDKLSTPLTGVFDERSGSWYTVLRIDDFSKEALACHTSGEVILSGETSIGYTGFRNGDAKAELVFGFPYQEAPKTYLRKLTLAPAVCAFEKLEKGEAKTLVWEIRKGRSESWSDFVAQVWETSYARLTPEPVDVDYTPGQAKEVLSRYFRQAHSENPLWRCRNSSPEDSHRLRRNETLLHRACSSQSRVRTLQTQGFLNIPKPFYLPQILICRLDLRLFVSLSYICRFA